MDELERHLGGADLGRVNAAGDQDDRLAGAEDLVALGFGRGAALKVELPLELLEAIEVFQRLGRADFDRDERVTVGRLAELTHADPIGCTRHEAHVLDDPVPAREFAVGSDPEAEKLLGRRHCGGARLNRRTGPRPDARRLRLACRRRHSSKQH